MSNLPDILSQLFGAPFVQEGSQAQTGPIRGDTADQSAALGVQSLNDGDVERAISHFKRSIAQRTDDDPMGRLDLGGAYEVADMAPQAFRQYLLAIRSTETVSEPYVGASQILLREGRFRDAFAKLQEAIRLEPANSFNHFKLAEALREAGEPKAALKTIQAAIVAAPGDSFYHYWAGDLLIVMKRWDEAVAALHAAIELSPGDDHLFFRAASALWGMGKRTEAIRAIRLASELDPDKNLYYGVLERLLEMNGDATEAKAEEQRAAKMDALDKDALQRFLAEIGEPSNG